MRQVAVALLLAGCVAGLALAAGADGGVRVETEEPRAFGYQVGDLVRRSVVLHAPAGWRLDTASLPRPGQRGQPIELRRVGLRSVDEAGGQRHELQLEYQVFFAPAAVRGFEIAPMRLRFESAARTEEVRVEAWPVTVAPLVPVEVSPRRGLGELQPDIAPPLIATAALQLRLEVWAVLAALLGAFLAAIYFGLPWRARQRRPFGLAWRELRRLDAQADDTAWRAACQRLHEALNHSAGEVLFASGLARFIAVQPRFAPLRDELARFLELSRREFFGGAARASDDARWLVDLSSRLRDAERGSA